MDRDLKGIIILIGGLILGAWAFYNDWAIINGYYDHRTLEALSTLNIVIEIGMGGLLSLGIYIVKPSGLTGVLGLVILGLVPMIMMIEYENQWYKGVSPEVALGSMIIIFDILIIGLLWVWYKRPGGLRNVLC